MPHLLEPDDPTAILHGAGQSPAAYGLYSACFAPLLPCLYMSYCGLKSMTMESPYWARLREQLQDLPADTVPQIGLSMTKDGSPELHYEQEVARGDHDAAIEALVAGLASLQRPVFLRIGYEFNGDWNGYHAPTFVAAWQRIAGAIRRAELPHALALVWCYAPEGSDKHWEAFYPGDEWVDWWGIDLFSREHFSQDDSHDFCTAANERGFPLMIGESTPRFVGVHTSDAWERWFQPYIDFIDRYRVRAFCYINWDWASYPMWSDWGDGRLEAAPRALRQRWLQFLSRPQIIHGGAPLGQASGGTEPLLLATENQSERQGDH